MIYTYGDNWKYKKNDKVTYYHIIQNKMLAEHVLRLFNRIGKIWPLIRRHTCIKRFSESISNVNNLFHCLRDVFQQMSNVVFASQIFFSPFICFSTHHKLELEQRVWQLIVLCWKSCDKLHCDVNIPRDNCWKTSCKRWMMLCTLDIALKNPVKLTNYLMMVLIRYLLYELFFAKINIKNTIICHYSTTNSLI